VREEARRIIPSRIRVFVDFDGTISLGDTTDLILERFADSAWKTVEADWVAGRIGSRECLARQIDLVRASPQALDAFLHGAAIDPHFPDFVALCRKFGLQVSVISDGLDRVVTTMLARAGIDIPIVANHLEWLGGERWRLGFPHARDDCRAAAGNCKCAALTAEPATLRVLVGDGRSDFCAAQTADLVIAKGDLAEHCRRGDLACVAFGNFSDATAVLNQWIGALRRRAGAPSSAEETVHAPPSA
jgi:2-hydroxy-3-keto-5-methylthiopentenyl-1-phosphate phosphatase